jgi:hypothetical protein
LDDVVARDLNLGPLVRQVQDIPGMARASPVGIRLLPELKKILLAG